MLRQPNEDRPDGHEYRDTLVHVRFTPSQVEQLEGFAERHGIDNRTEAVRVAVNLQLRYDEWAAMKEHKHGKSDLAIETLARALLRDHPEATKAGLFFHTSNRVGRYVDNSQVKRCVERVWSEHKKVLEAADGGEP